MNNTGSWKFWSLTLLDDIITKYDIQRRKTMHEVTPMVLLNEEHSEEDCLLTAERAFDLY